MKPQMKRMTFQEYDEWIESLEGLSDEMKGMPYPTIEDIKSLYLEPQEDEDPDLLAFLVFCYEFMPVPEGPEYSKVELLDVINTRLELI